MAWYALLELLNRAPSKDTIDQVTRIVTSATAALPVENRFIRVIQPGRTRMVLVHVVLPNDFIVEGLPQLDKLRTNTLKKLKQTHPETALDMVFTADPQWGAPQEL
jgi:predicted Co/Zn/Cd cation transporter (cation efflux family)